jgi:hypothetical protein
VADLPRVQRGERAPDAVRTWRLPKLGLRGISIWPIIGAGVISAYTSRTANLTKGEWRLFSHIEANVPATEIS